MSGVSVKPLRIVFRGNFQVDLPSGVEPWSTEWHVSRSMELLGHEVVRLQEDRVGWAETVEACESADLFWWTQTYGYALNWPKEEAVEAVAYLNARMPTVGHHLDLWRGLDRAWQVDDEPYFRLRWLFTADGDGQEWFESKGVNHRWLPPAVFGPDCYAGQPQEQYAADVVFVGSWQSYGHAEHWPARRDMLDVLRRRYRRRFRRWPENGRPAVRGQALNAVYASSKVAIGDSCFADRSHFYVSDRLFESAGRGAFTLFPYIEHAAELLEDGVHVRYFPPGDHAEMFRLIDWYLDHDDEREQIRAAGQAHVRDHHTYGHRVEQALAVLEAEGAFAGKVPV